MVYGVHVTGDGRYLAYEYKDTHMIVLENSSMTT